MTTDLFQPQLFLVAVRRDGGRAVTQDFREMETMRASAKIWAEDGRIAYVQLCEHTPNGPICTHEARLRNGVPVIKPVDLTKAARTRKPRKIEPRGEFKGLG